LPWANLTVAPSVPTYAAMTYFLDGSNFYGQLNTIGTELAYCLPWAVSDLRAIF